MLKQIDFKKLYAQLSGWAFPLLVVLLILSLFTCNRRGQAMADLSFNLDSVARQAKIFENERGELIAENKILKAEHADQIKELTDTIFNLKKRDEKRIKEVQQYTRIIQRYEAADKFAPFLPIPEDDSTGWFTRLAETQPPPDSNYVRVPRPFMYMDSTITFGGRVTRRGVWLDSIRIDNTVHLRTVVNKTGFLNLGRSETVQVINSNKGITVTGLTSITVTKRISWWHKWCKPVAFAVLGGIAGREILR